MRGSTRLLNPTCLRPRPPHSDPLRNRLLTLQSTSGRWMLGRVSSNSSMFKTDDSLLLLLRGLDRPAIRVLRVLMQYLPHPLKTRPPPR